MHVYAGMKGWLAGMTSIRSIRLETLHSTDWWATDLQRRRTFGKLASAILENVWSKPEANTFGTTFPTLNGRSIICSIASKGAESEMRLCGGVECPADRVSSQVSGRGGLNFSLHLCNICLIVFGLGLDICVICCLLIAQETSPYRFSWSSQ